MRTLKFIVDGMSITQDPRCDFEGLVPGSEGYLQAEFQFSKEWAGCKQVAGFYSMLGTEYPPQLLKDGKTCMIPAEALQKRQFKMMIIGAKEGMKIATNKITVNQNGGKA